MNNKRISYIAFMQVICAFAVVSLHVNECFWSFSRSFAWNSANLIETFFYFAVPVFFMVSGATLIDFYDRYTLKEYFKKRFIKIFLPFIAWSLIGLLYNLLTHNVELSSINLKYIYNGIFQTTIIGIYWFFIPLFCVYLCIPLFASVDKCKRKEVFTYLTITGLLINSIIPFIITTAGLDFAWAFDVPIVGGYLFFVLAGYILKNEELKVATRIIIYFLGIIGFLMQLIGTKNLSYKVGYVDQTYKGYTNVPSILQAIAIFVLLKQVGSMLCQNEKIENVVLKLSRYSFSIYLMHWYIICVARRIVNYNTSSLIYRLCCPFVVIALVIVLTWIMRKIPIIKRIVP